ncbi:MAG: chemotaxis response regulator protein-glutamate methylesterase [Pseudomonadota bacterium]
MTTATISRPPAAPATTAEQDLIRVSVVDDAVVVRGMIGRWIGEEDGIVLAGTHRNGRVAVDQIAKETPHVIVLDIEMPEMDGITALPLLLKECPGAAIIMASTLTRRNAEISLKAMSLGASDYVPKPETNSGVSTSADFRRELIEKVRALGERSKRRAKFRLSPKKDPVERTRPAAAASGSDAAAAAVASPSSFKLRKPGSGRPAVLVIGSSTGGPPALSELFAALDKRVFSAVPIVVTQHMPAAFTPILAEHIGRSADVTAREGVNGEDLKAGAVYIAPGGQHLVIDGSRTTPRIGLNDDPPVHYCKPAVDPMFTSAAKVFGSAVLGVVLTGMGQDGADGGVVIADAGGTVIAQDQETSVVWGMPGATAHAGCCSAVLPLERIADAINRKVLGSSIA